MLVNKEIQGLLTWWFYAKDYVCKNITDNFYVLHSAKPVKALSPHCFPLLLVHWHSFQNCTLKWLPTSFNCSTISLFFSAFPSWVSPQILKAVLWSLSTTMMPVCCSLTDHIPLTFQVWVPDWWKCHSLIHCRRPVLLSQSQEPPGFNVSLQFSPHFSIISLFLSFNQCLTQVSLQNFPNLPFFSPIFLIVWQARNVMSPLLWSTEAEKLSLHGVMLCWAPAQSLSSDSKKESTLVVYLSVPAFLFGKNCFSGPAGVKCY